MADYRRWYVAGGTYFFTVVTQDRRRFLATDLARSCLRDAIETVRAKWPFEIVAWVLLPDHLHCVWQLPRGDQRFSTRWTRIKGRFTRQYLERGGDEGMLNYSRQKHRERTVWQRRFWEHTCSDDDDLKRCVDYLHWNPVKHGLAQRVSDYPWSTFHRYVKAGEYDLNWGSANPTPGFEMPE